MATRLEEQGTLQCAHEPDQTTGWRLWYGCRIRLHDGSPCAAVRAEAADCSEEGGALRVAPTFQSALQHYAHSCRHYSPCAARLRSRVSAGAEGILPSVIRSRRCVGSEHASSAAGFRITPIR